MTDRQNTQSPQELMAELSRDLSEFLLRLPFNKRNQLDVHTVSLHATAIELASDMALLSDARSGKGIPLIARSIVEACLDLENLLADPGYAKRLKVKYLHDLVRIDSGALQFLGYPGFDWIDENQLREKLRRNKQELKMLKSQGIKPVSLPDKFELLGLTAEYSNVAPVLNQFVHNTYDALFRRHVFSRDGDYELQIFAGHNDTDYLGIFAFAIIMILSSAEKIHEDFGSAVASQVSEYCENMRLRLNSFDR